MKTQVIIWVLFVLALSSGVSLRAQGIERVTLSKDLATTVCPGKRNHSCVKEHVQIKVSSYPVTKGNETFVYYYIVSGGKILGSGPNVVWDLSDFAPGKYTITVGVGKDNLVYGKTIAKTITLIECPVCHPPCSCWSMSIEGPTKPIAVGNSFVVRAVVSGGDWQSIAYRWDVVGGSITAGQGTDTALVSTIFVKGSTSQVVKVKLRVDATPNCGCPTEVEESFALVDKE